MLRHAPGDPGPAAATVVDALGGRAGRTKTGRVIVDATNDRDGPVVVLLGRPSVAEHPDAVIQAASLLAARPDTRFLSVLPASNVHGALDLGLTPGFLPGRVTLDAARQHYRTAWGAVPDVAGRDATGILHGAADGSIRTLILVGCDPILEFPDRNLARAALEQVDTVVAVAEFPDSGTARASVVLPPAVWGEQAGSTTNLEGRVLRLGRRVTAEGSTLESWRIPAELAARLGTDFDLESVEEVQDEIARVAPAFAGVDPTLLRRARDGVVLPLADHVDEVTFAQGAPGERPSWEPISPAPEPVDDAASVDRPPSAPTPTLALYRWDGTASTPSVVPVDAYALRLVAGHILYGDDAIVAASPPLAPLRRPTTLAVSGRDRDRLGVNDGDVVRVTARRGSVDLPVTTDATLPPGTAFIAANLSGPGAPDLIDIDAPVTELRVETLP